MFSHKKTSRCFVAGVSGIPRYHLRQSLFLPLGVTKCRATPPLVPIGYSCSTLHPYSNSCPPWPLGKNKNYILLNMILFNIMVFASTLNFVKLLIYLYSQVNVLQSVNVLEGNKQNISLLSNVHF